MSSPINSNFQTPFGYEKLLNVVSQCSQVTRSILDQRTKLQNLKLKEESRSRHEEQQRKILQSKITENEEKGWDEPGKNIFSAEMKNAMTQDMSDNKPAAKIARSGGLLDTEKTVELKLTHWEDERREVQAQPPSVIMEEEEGDNYWDDYEEDEDILTEKEESGAISNSHDYHEKSKSKDDKENEATNVDEDTSIQYSESMDDQKNSPSSRDASASDLTQSHNEKYESEDARHKAEMMSNIRFQDKPNCSASCKKRVAQNYNLYCNFETESCAIRQKIHAKCQRPQFASLEDEDLN